MNDTLSFYPVDDDVSDLTDVYGLANGKPYLGRNVSTTTVRPGPGPCGNALSFDAPTIDELWFVEIDSSDHQVVPLSVDFWVNLAPEVQGERAGILTRDQTGFNAGDLSITQIQNNNEAQILIRTQSDSEEKFACSGVLDRDTWHHVAVTIGDGMVVQLFVDGVAVKQAGNSVAVGGSTAVCQDRDFGDGINMSRNQWPWVVGASNASSSPEVQRINEFFVGGAIDNLRIRNAIFTEEEAAALFVP